jgi:hypothetical protein
MIEAILRNVLLASAAVVALSSPARAGDFDGRWVLVQSTTTVAEVPIAGRIYATTTAVSVHDVVSTETRMRGGGSLCSVDVDSGTAFVKTILPPALRRVLPTPTIDASLSTKRGKLAFFQSSPKVVLGARLARIDDPLPTRADDARVVDQDGDGAPGVTVRVEGIASGDVHVVQRSWATLDGNLLVDGTFGGLVRHGLSQSVIGATSSFLRDPPNATPVASRSWFRLGRVERAAGCAEAAKLAKRWAR